MIVPVLSEIQRSFDLILDPTCVVEIRGLDVDYQSRSVTVSGYFDAAHRNDAAKLAAGMSGHAIGVYMTLNPIHPGLLARAANRGDYHPKATTADHDITRRRVLPIDFDPRRPKGVSSTDEEHEAALNRAREVRDWLTGRGWPAPIFADSGNGGHLIYRVDLPNDDASKILVESCLKALHTKFSDAQVEVDRTCFNAARIWKLYGTLACKGDATPDRPHRAGRIIEAPSHLDAAEVH